MAIDISKSYSNLKATIYENRKVNTTPRSFTEDIFLIPTATELAKQEILMQYIAGLQSFSSMYDLLISPSKIQIIADALGQTTETVELNIGYALDKLASNYNKTRKQATESSTVISFWRIDPVSTSEAGNVIAAGTVVASSTTGIQYTTTVEVPVSSAYKDTDFGTNSYMVDVPAVCSVKGSVGNANVDTITTTITTVTGFPNVTNKVAVSNGTDTETNVNFVFRMQNEISGSRLGTQNGLQAFILQNTKATDVTVVGANDIEMVRDRGDGGCFDVYVKDVDVASTSTTFTLPVSKSFTYIQGLRPVINDTSGILNPASASVIVKQDTATVYKQSASGRDVAIFSTTIAPGAYTLTYTYNKLISDIQALLNDPENYTGADILVKEAIPVPIDIVFQVVVTQTSSEIKEQIVNTLLTNIKNYIATFKLGQAIDQSDIINLCYIEGVDRVVLPMTYFKKTNDTVNRVNDTITVDRTSYIVLNNLTITV